MNERVKITVVLSAIVLGAVQITVGQLPSASGPTTSSARQPGETTAAYAKRLAAETSRRRFGEDVWKLGMQAYSFNRFTFEEAVAKTKALGMRYIEVYPGQILSKEKPDVKTDHNMSGPDRQLMMKMLRQAGGKLL